MPAEVLEERRNVVEIRDIKVERKPFPPAGGTFAGRITFVILHKRSCTKGGIPFVASPFALHNFPRVSFPPKPAEWTEFAKRSTKKRIAREKSEGRAELVDAGGGFRGGGRRSGVFRRRNKWRLYYFTYIPLPKTTRGSVATSVGALLAGKFTDGHPIPKLNSTFRHLRVE